MLKLSERERGMNGMCSHLCFRLSCWALGSFFCHSTLVRINITVIYGRLLPSETMAANISKRSTEKKNALS